MMRKRIASYLWIATTPLALTLLLAAPWAGATTGHDSTNANEAGGEHGGGHVITNPIQNFARLHYSRDVNGGSLESGETPMPPPFSMALFNFAVLAFLLGKYAGPPLAGFVRNRHHSIARQLDEAASLREEAKRKLAEYQRRLSSLDGEIAQISASMRAEAEAERNRILAEAQAKIARMKRDAEQQIQADIQGVRAALEREVVTAAVAAAEKLLREKMTDADQRTLSDHFLAGLELQPPQKGGTTPGMAGVVGGKVA
ncbi:MAG: ATP synthase F0 subunit B [Pseudomonadota bacterium]